MRKTSLMVRCVLFLTLCGMLSTAANSAEPEKQAPAYSLKDSAGKTYTPQSYPDQHVLLVFYRGVQCVHCMEQLAGMAKQADDFDRRGIRIIAISHELPSSGTVEQIRSKLGIEYPQCVDPQRRAFRDYGCLDSRDRDMHGLFLISPSGELLYESVSEHAMTDIDRILEICDKSLES